MEHEGSTIAALATAPFPSGLAVVRISGPVGELVLELYGRRSVAQVRYEGADDAVARVRAASFGI